MLNDNIILYSPSPIAQSVDPQTKQMTTYEHQKLMFVSLIDNLDKQFLPSSGPTKNRGLFWTNYGRCTSFRGSSINHGMAEKKPQFSYS